MDFNFPEQARLVIACALAIDPLGENAKLLGHQCAACRAKLQIAAIGREALAQQPDALLLCNPCALNFARWCEAHDQLAGNLLTDAAEIALANGSEWSTSPVAQWIKKYRAENEPN
jgi:hypothetical protein